MSVSSFLFGIYHRKELISAFFKHKKVSLSSFVKVLDIRYCHLTLVVSLTLEGFGVVVFKRKRYAHTEAFLRSRPNIPTISYVSNRTYRRFLTFEIKHTAYFLLCFCPVFWTGAGLNSGFFFLSAVIGFIVHQGMLFKHCT